MNSTRNTPSDSDLLRDALFDWRDERTREDIGDTILEDFGGCLILPAQMVILIVDCAQAGKLQTLDNLKHEIPVWPNDLMEKNGESLLAVIHSVFPPLHPHTPQASTSPVSDSGCTAINDLGA
ncbi:hypothetical protein V8D89_014206 [Ganoderma adspersum]